MVSGSNQKSDSSARSKRAKEATSKRANSSSHHPIPQEKKSPSSSSEPELRLRAPKRTRTRVQLSSTYRQSRGSHQVKSGEREKDRYVGRESSASPRIANTKKATRQSLDSTAKKTGRKGTRETERQKVPVRSTEERLSERKRQERERRARRQFLRWVGLFAGLGLLLGLVVWGVIALLHSPWFAASEVSVIGAGTLSEDEIRKLAAVSSKETVLLLNNDTIKKRLQACVWLADVRVEVSLPHKVTLTVAERKPEVVVSAEDGATWLISHDGYWLGVFNEDTKEVTDPSSVLPPLVLETARLIPVEKMEEEVTPKMGKRVKNDSIENALAILRGLDPELRARITRVSAPDVVRTALFTSDGIELDIGVATHLAEKNQIIANVLETEKGKVVLINVRSIEKPTWRGLTP